MRPTAIIMSCRVQSYGKVPSTPTDSGVIMAYHSLCYTITTQLPFPLSLFPFVQLSQIVSHLHSCLCRGQLFVRKHFQNPVIDRAPSVRMQACPMTRLQLGNLVLTSTRTSVVELSELAQQSSRSPSYSSFCASCLGSSQEQVTG